MNKIVLFLILAIPFLCTSQENSDQHKSEIKLKQAVNPRDGQIYIWIPPGTFYMGCSQGDNECQNMKPFANENPRHRVVISKGFWIGKTETTVHAYKKYAQSTGRKGPVDFVHEAPEKFQEKGFPKSDGHPMAYVTWEDAIKYCEWAGGRLPTEAEWEYAARAGSNTSRYGNLDDIAWCADNSGHSILNSSELNDRQLRNQKLIDNENNTHPVGRKTPNYFGIHDMLGNVAEYCSDWFDEDFYQISNDIDPKGPMGIEYKVIRGGSFKDRPLGVRVSRRTFMLLDHRFNSIGFRCVLDSIPNKTSF